jgi:putative hydrolase of the HAD superfamily
MFHPRLICFDCAGTLLNVRWDAAEVAVEAAATAGLDLPVEQAKAAFRQQFGDRWEEYTKVNLVRDTGVMTEWWLDFAKTWGAPFGISADDCRTMIRIIWSRMYSPMEESFRPFPEVRDCLERLRERKFALAVVSNWDFSLHGILEAQGLSGYFHRVYASLEVGAEKPDPKIFQTVLGDFNIDPAFVTHIGDDPLDDVEGARRAMVHGVLLDRSKFSSEGGVFANLTDFADRLCKN